MFMDNMYTQCPTCLRTGKLKSTLAAGQTVECSCGERFVVSALDVAQVKDGLWKGISTHIRHKQAADSERLFDLLGAFELSQQEQRDFDRLRAIVASQNPTTKRSPVTPEQPARRSRKILWIGGVLVGLLLLVGGVVLGVLLSENNSGNVVASSSAGKPAVQQPVPVEPVAAEPAAEQPVPVEPAAEPAADGPVAAQPVPAQPAVVEPALPIVEGADDLGRVMASRSGAVILVGYIRLGQRKNYVTGRVQRFSGAFNYWADTYTNIQWYEFRTLQDDKQSVKFFLDQEDRLVEQLESQLKNSSQLQTGGWLAVVIHGNFRQPTQKFEDTFLEIRDVQFLDPQEKQWNAPVVRSYREAQEQEEKRIANEVRRRKLELHAKGVRSWRRADAGINGLFGGAADEVSGFSSDADGLGGLEGMSDKFGLSSGIGFQPQDDLEQRLADMIRNAQDPQQPVQSPGETKGLFGKTTKISDPVLIGKFSRVYQRYVYIIPFDLKAGTFGKETRLGMYSKLPTATKALVDEMKNK